MTHPLQRTPSGIVQALALLIALGVATAIPSAQQARSTDACERRLTSFMRSEQLVVTAATRERAVQECVAGRLEHTRTLLRQGHAERARQAATQCLQALNAFIGKAGISPAASTLTHARQRCATGNREAAIAVVKANPTRAAANTVRSGANPQ